MGCRRTRRRSFNRRQSPERRSRYVRSRPRLNQARPLLARPVSCSEYLPQIRQKGWWLSRNQGFAEPSYGHTASAPSCTTDRSTYWTRMAMPLPWRATRSLSLGGNGRRTLLDRGLHAVLRRSPETLPVDTVSPTWIRPSAIQVDRRNAIRPPPGEAERALCRGLRNSTSAKRGYVASASGEVGALARPSVRGVRMDAAVLTR